MKRAVLGVHMHSGWGVLVAVSGDAGSLEVLERRRIVTADPTIEGAKQPYHFAENLGLREAERYLANCTAISDRLAFEVIKAVVGNLEARRCPIACCAVLLASGRALPPLPKILASHALIHTAEGELFREELAVDVWEQSQRVVQVLLATLRRRVQELEQAREVRP